MHRRTKGSHSSGATTSTGSTSLMFTVFRKRQMPRQRPDYGDYLEKLGLNPGNDPFEVMARNEARKFTDRIEVFAPPVPTATVISPPVLCERY